MTKTLDVLLIESHPGDGVVDADRLTAAGHRVHHCWADSGPDWAGARKTEGLCVGVTDGTCPLDQGIDVALLVRRRISTRPTVGEAGASCALRAGVPLVEHGPDVLDPFDPWLTGRVRDDVAAACEAAADHGFDPLREEIRSRTRRAFLASGVDPDDVEITFELDWPRLTIRLQGPAVGAPAEQAIGVRVLDALHTTGRSFGQVNVSYDAVTG